MENKDYKLKKLEVELQTYGEFKGKYKGRIVFENDDYESFSFNLTEEQIQKYLELIAPQIVKSANELGSKLIESLQLKKDE